MGAFMDPKSANPDTRVPLFICRDLVITLARMVHSNPADRTVFWHVCGHTGGTSGKVTALNAPRSGSRQENLIGSEWMAMILTLSL